MGEGKSAILRDNFNAYLTTLFFIFLSSLIIGFITNGDRNNGKAGIAVLLLMVWIGCLIYNIYLRYQIYKEVAYITNQPLFLVAFWLGVTIFLLPIAFIIYIIAWIGVREIIESESAGEYRKEVPNSNYATIGENPNSNSYQPQITETQQSIETSTDSAKSNKYGNELIFLLIAIVAIVWNYNCLKQNGLDT